MNKLAFSQEFLPGALPVGCNELEVSTTLSGLPDMKWQAAVGTLVGFPPVVPILGIPFLLTVSFPV